MPQKKTPHVMEVEVRMVPSIKKVWWKIKKSKLFLWFRHSRLNPYHWGLKNIKASSYEEAREMAYAMGEVQFLYNGTRYYSERRNRTVNRETPHVMDVEVKMLLPIKRMWWKIKESRLFLWFRHSRLNPYHCGLKNIKASSYEEAREKAYAMGEVQFLYNGTRYYSERHDCSVNEEYKKYNKVLRGRGNVADRIPRNKNGNLDLLAEDPIVISIIPFEGPSLIGHACMQYKDRVVNRLLPSVHTNALYSEYKSFAEYYFIYPSKIGIEPKKLLREMDKHNIKYGYKKYNPFTNNCSQNVIQILEKIGVKDIDLYGPDKLGIRYATPGNNPFGVGLKDWCFRNGVHVHLDEMKKLYNRYPVSDVGEKRKEQEKIRVRYKKITGRKDIVTKADLLAKKKLQDLKNQGR